MDTSLKHVEAQYTVMTTTDEVNIWIVCDHEYKDKWTPVQNKNNIYALVFETLTIITVKMTRAGITQIRNYSKHCLTNNPELFSTVESGC